MRKLLLPSVLLLISCYSLHTFANSKEHNKKVGIFEYTNPYCTETCQENAVIVLTEEEGKLTGYFYGTSDEFDEAREGYLAAFFVTKMQSLVIIEDSIKFTLNTKNSDFLTKPVNIKYKSTNEAKQAGYKNWENSIRTLAMPYKAEFKGQDTIFFKGNKDFENRYFIRKEQSN